MTEDLLTEADLEDLMLLIMDYREHRREKALTPIFREVSRICIRLIEIYHSTTARNPMIRDDVVNQVAEKFVLNVWKRPEYFTRLEMNLLLYLSRSISNGITEHMRKRRTSGRGTVIAYSDVAGEGLQALIAMAGSIPPPDVQLRGRDQIRKVIRAVSGVLRKTARFSDRGEGLVWLIVRALLDGSDEALQGLDYADRVALRSVMIRSQSELARIIDRYARSRAPAA